MQSLTRQNQWLWRSLLVAAISWSMSAIAEEPDIVTAEDFEPATRKHIDEKVPLFLGEPICIPVEVFGESITAVIDTGASYCVLDSKYRNRLGSDSKRVNGRTAVDFKNFESYRSPPIKIGKVNIHPFETTARTACFDMANVRETSGLEIHGVIGMSYLSRLVLHLNFDESFVAIRKTTFSREGHKEKIELDSIPFIKMQVSDTGHQEFIIDTGSSGDINLDRALFERLVARGKIVLIGTGTVATAGGNSRVRTGILDYGVLGPFKVQNILVTESLNNAIGLRFLRRFETEFDFSNGRAYFRPGKLLHKPDPRNLAGISTIRREKTTLIEEIKPQSVAERSGLRKDDCLIKVNGTKASEMRLSGIRKAFCQPETDLTLDYERDGQLHTVTLRLIAEPDPFPIRE